MSPRYAVAICTAIAVFVIIVVVLLSAWSAPMRVPDYLVVGTAGTLGAIVVLVAPVFISTGQTLWRRRSKSRD